MADELTPLEEAKMQIGRLQTAVHQLKNEVEIANNRLKEEQYRCERYEAIIDHMLERD